MAPSDRASREYERARLAELQRLRILDTEAEKGFDEITQRAAQLFDVPIALITLIDEKRQWFKSRVGLEIQETPREHSFCTHAILQEESMVVEDARLDERFNHNPLVFGEPGIRFYAGAPLITLNGFELGTLCIIDRVPRKMSKHHIDTLQSLSREVIYMLELRVPH